MRIEVDRSRCTALGNCEAFASAYFQVDDEATLQVLQPVVAEQDLAAVEHAVDMCPTGALSLVED